MLKCIWWGWAHGGVYWETRVRLWVTHQATGQIENVIQSFWECSVSLQSVHLPPVSTQHWVHFSVSLFFPFCLPGTISPKIRQSLIIDIPQPSIISCSTFSLSTFYFLHIFIRIFGPKIATHYWYWPASNCLLTKKTDFFVRKTTKNYN